ncbi:MAG: menaquinone biosynthesis protein [Desulfohalobiaceae bacterium]|nr:menaquinone biosynthesis protein [Desulfohalobiaceae bacterium]
MDTQARQTLRLGKISYLNVLPIYYPLEKGYVANDFRLVSGPPARLNELMARGKLDISAASSFEYARNHQRYFLVPDLAIGSQGPVQSVLLLSRVPLARLEEDPICISSQTHTSAALLRLILRERFHLNPDYQTGNITELISSADPPSAFLAIGDEALRLRDLPAYPYKLDLGQAWLEWTGLPFIFGVWIINRDSVKTRGKDIQEGCHKILAAKQWGIRRMAFFSDLISREGILNREEVFSYFQGLVYDFAEREQKGLQLFFNLLAKSGAIETSPDLNFLNLGK